MKDFKTFLNEGKQELVESAGRGRVDIDMKDGVVSGLSADYEAKDPSTPRVSVTLRSKYGNTPKIEISCSSGEFKDAKAAMTFANAIKMYEEVFQKLELIKNGDTKEVVNTKLKNVNADLKLLGIAVHID